MMTLGLIVSLIVTFLLPSLINLLASDKEMGFKDTEKSIITYALSSLQKIASCNFWFYFCNYFI